jgi:hypothetical protein
MKTLLRSSLLSLLLFAVYAYSATANSTNHSPNFAATVGTGGLPMPMCAPGGPVPTGLICPISPNGN